MYIHILIYIYIYIYSKNYLSLVFYHKKHKSMTRVDGLIILNLPFNSQLDWIRTSQWKLKNGYVIIRVEEEEKKRTSTTYFICVSTELCI